MDRSGNVPEEILLETKTAFTDRAAPRTAAEVATDLDCSSEHVDTALATLEDDGVLNSRVIGDETQIWWLIDNGDVTPSETTDTTSVFERVLEISPVGGGPDEPIPAEQRDNLHRIHEVNELMRAICRAIVRATTTEEIETAVCEQLAKSAQYRFAVLGHFSPSYERYTPHAWAGDGKAYLDTVLAAPDAPPLDQSAGARAARTGEVQVIPRPTEARHEYWEQIAKQHGFQGYAAVPICHEEITYCVLGVYTDQLGVFDKGEQELLAELGEIVGYGLHTIANMEDLRSEQVVELVFESRELARPFHDIGSRNLQINVDSIIELADESVLLYFDVEGVSADTFVDVIADIPTTKDVRLLSTVGDRCRVEVRKSCTSIASVLADRDGQLAGLGIEDETLRLEGQLPRTSDVDDAVRAVEALASDLELVSKQVVLTPQLFRSIIEDQLTDCQQTTLELSYHAGYFEQPRSSSGTELAQRLDVTPTTFHRHLRNAQLQLFERLYEGDEQTTRE